MSKPRVVITETLDEVPARWLAEQADVVWHGHDEPGLDAVLAEADALVVRTYTQVDQALLVRSPQLRVVGRAGVGLDNINIPACRSRGVEVVYTPDANTQAVVEYVLGLILDVVRPRQILHQPVSALAFHELRKQQVGLQLDRLTLGVLGFGRIGRRIGEVAHAIGMKVLVNDLLPEVELRQAVHFPFEYVDKPALYHRSDIVTIHVDGRASNRGMIDAAALAQLKATCLLINAARGMLVDAEALATWAKAVTPTGGCAVLDVHEPEPIPENYPLWGLPNVKLLPHLASRTNEALENMSWVVRDVMAVLRGEPAAFPAPIG